MSRERVVMRVAAKSTVKSLAGSIVKHWSEGKDIEIVTIGAGALNQAIKGIGSASGILATKGYTLLTRVGFTEVEVNGEVKTAIRQVLIIE